MSGINHNQPSLLVIVGAGGERDGAHNGDGLIGGDLFGRKLLPALFDQFRQHLFHRGAPFPQQIVLADVHPVKDAAGYVEHLAQVNRGKSRLLRERKMLSGWQDFVRHFIHVQTGRSVQSFTPVFAEIKRFIAAHPEGRVMLYLALPYVANPEVAEQIRAHAHDSGFAERLHVLFEKPAYLERACGAKLKSSMGRSGIPESQIGIVEHMVPAFRHGLRQFVATVYESPMYNAALNSGTVECIDLIMSEPVGSEFRQSYPGTLGDSGNHIAAVMGLILGDPRICDRWNDAIMQRVDGLLPPSLLQMPEDPAQEEYAIRRAMECLERLRCSGRYGICMEDHGAPSVHFPTACAFELYPGSLDGRRWRFGETRLRVVHQKNGPRLKRYSVVYRFRKDPRKSTRDILEFCFDGRLEHDPDTPYWWVRTTMDKMAADGASYDRHTIFDPHKIPDHHAETYNAVMAAVLRFQMQDFMPLGWQAVVNRLLIEGIACALDKTNKADVRDGGQRVYFPKGMDVFGDLDAVDMINLKEFMSDLGSPSIAMPATV